MPNINYPSHTFRSGAVSHWETLASDLRERLENLKRGRLIELGFTIEFKEVAWVTIYRADDGTVTASGPHGPYPSTYHQQWSWKSDVDQPDQAADIAHTIIEFLKALDDIPSGKEPGDFGGQMNLRVTTPQSAFLNRDPQWDEYAEHRTGMQVGQLLHYGHLIPISRGFTKEYIDKHYPGWDWNSLSRVMQAAGVFVNRGGAPATCEPTVKAVHFTDAEHWAVEWLSGEVTRSAPRLGPERSSER
ncbi:MAG: hypothetical protein KF739_11565 [Cryobacterium sp.]|nr:hypothetical protein [Cryobacterium sp.]